MRRRLTVRSITPLLLLAGIVTVGVGQYNTPVMERGRFVVTPSEVSGHVATGGFTIVRNDAGGVELIETLRAEVGERTSTFNVRMDLNAQFQPQAFLMSQRQGEDTWTYSVRIKGDTARLTIEDPDGDSGTRSFQSTDGFVVLALTPRLFGQTALLWRRVVQTEGELDAHALLPGTPDPLRSLEAVRVAPVRIRHDGETEEVARVRLTVGEPDPARYELLGQGDQLYGTVMPNSTEPLTYRSDLFPNGLTVQR